eukprot:7838019-Lingulodinium_polyedra.AAC.1
MARSGSAPPGRSPSARIGTPRGQRSPGVRSGRSEQLGIGPMTVVMMAARSHDGAEAHSHSYHPAEGRPE